MNIIQPKGFITNTTPVFEWDNVENATSYTLIVKNNVTGEGVINETLTTNIYQSVTTFPLGTYSIQVTTDNDIAIETFVITNKVATYTIVGREGDTQYLNYKQAQQNVRRNIKMLGQVADSVLSSSEVITAILAQSGDADLVKYHADTITQTPGLSDDFALVAQLAQQISEVVKRITLRDTAF